MHLQAAYTKKVGDCIDLHFTFHFRPLGGSEGVTEGNNNAPPERFFAKDWGSLFCPKHSGVIERVYRTNHSDAEFEEPENIASKGPSFNLY